jgi:3-phenylpropionate/trans-cinnamate dioxygenase ferredoxin subunit
VSKWVAVADQGDLAPGEYRLVQVDDLELALFHTGDSICCIEDLCTHDGGNLVEGDFDGRVVTCPRHGARFDVCTGEALCLPAVAATPKHAVRLRDGKIEVEVDGE